jgi:chromosome segregation ATPase
MMQKQIDDLLKLLEDEKQNMGAAGKRREDELLNEIGNLRRELAERAARIDELKITAEARETTIKERDTLIAELQATIKALEAKILDLEY